MEQRALKVILGRFRRADYEHLVANWMPLSGGLQLAQGVDLRKIAKSEFIDAVAKKLKKNVTPDIIAGLDLFYLQKYTNRKLWRVYKIEKIDEKNPNKLPTVQHFNREMRKEIQLYLDADVFSVEHHDSWWTRIAVNLPTSQDIGVTRGTSAYMVHIPNTDYVYIADLRASHRPYLRQVLMTVFNGHDMTDLNLSGHHLISLFRMVLKHNSQEQEIALPGMERLDEEENLSDQVYNENRGEKRSRDKFLHETFGPNKQPKLEKIEYKLETKFKSYSIVPSMANHDTIFHCRVKFEGPSVLEGIRNLGAAGLAELPMKSHVGKVHTMARNVFRLQQND